MTANQSLSSTSVTALQIKGARFPSIRLTNINAVSPDHKKLLFQPKQEA